MELTGKTKIEFEEYYLKIVYDSRADYLKWPSDIILKKFYREIDAMKCGVYEDYFDSVGISPQTYSTNYEKWFLNILKNGRYLTVVKDSYNSRPLARTAAIEKANEIRNEQLNK